MKVNLPRINGLKNSRRDPAYLEHLMRVPKPEEAHTLKKWASPRVARLTGGTRFAQLNHHPREVAKRKANIRLATINWENKH